MKIIWELLENLENHSRITQELRENSLRITLRIAWDSFENRSRIMRITQKS